jgi:hypothetical protein
MLSVVGDALENLSLFECLRQRLPVSIHQRLPISVKQNGSSPSDDDYLLVASCWYDVTDINCLDATEIPYSALHPLW